MRQSQMYDSSKFSTVTNRRSRSTSSPRDIELQYFENRNELEYPLWWTRDRFSRWLHSVPDDTFWNILMCIVALVAIVWVAVEHSHPVIHLVDALYNVIYAVHVLGIAYDSFITIEIVEVGYCTMFRFVVDLASYLHYVLVVDRRKEFKLLCYYLRLHRPFKYLWQLNDYNLKSSILGTTLKYCYIFLVLRVTWAIIWLHVDEFEREYTEVAWRRAPYEVQQDNRHFQGNKDNIASQFLFAVYIVNKMFIPIGPSVAPSNDIERITCLFVMISGCLVVTGAAVASLSLVISIYMRPEEEFRTRYRLIMKEMKTTNVPLRLREKVETFYKMYWHKQRAVSATQLLPTYPPTLSTTIYADIYFEATQKSRILCDLSYEFLSEVAKKMSTIHYIPGDAIIKRLSTKSSIIYITYGDIEMLTAEDNSTAILRMTRGTIVSPVAGAVAAGCGPAHVEIRAATFCAAHVLAAADLWRLALKYATGADHTRLILAAFYEHFERVKRHYYQKTPEEVKHKSSILHFKRNLLALKEAKDVNGNPLLPRADFFLEIAGCYIMRNRPDAALNQETDAICLRSTFPCILQPESSLQIAWQSFVSAIILVVSIVHPYYLVYTSTVPLEFRFFDYVVTVVYALDLIAYLSTGANVEEGVPISFAQTSSQQMRSHWFVLDVLSTLPIFEFIGEGHFAGINKLLRLPKVFRVLKSMEELCVYQSNGIRFLSYTLLLLVACYLIAALQQAFMCFQFGYCLVTNFTHSPYWSHEPLDGAAVEDRLTFGLYWAISMITFTCHLEMWGLTKWDNVLYTMFVLEVCIVLHIFIEAAYSATIVVTTALREDYDSSIGMVKDFLIRNHVDPVIRQRFITYLQLCWYTDKAYSLSNKKTSIFYDLPPHVYQDIVASQRSKYLLTVPFIKLLGNEDLKHVSSAARLFYTSPNEVLLNTGDISYEMYVIKQGICEIFNPYTRNSVGFLGPKTHFGVLECLLRLPAYYTIRAVTHVQVFSISRKVLSHVTDLPQIKDAIEFAKTQPEYTRLMMRRFSFLCYEPPKPTPNREQFPLPKKYEMDYEYLHPFRRLGFLSILRYIFPRFTIRPDGDYLVRYECLRAACALGSAMLFPGYSYLVLQWPVLYFLAWLLDISAYFDIFQRMLVGYFNEHGILVFHPSSTAAHYLKGAFIVDLIVCLPLEYLEAPGRESFHDNYRLTQTRQFLMLNRLLQLYRLPSAMLTLSGYIERRDILLVIKAIPLFMALLNVLTCFVVYYSVEIFCSMDDTGWQIIPHKDKGGSWIELFSSSFRFNVTETPWNLHLASYFWVVFETTTTGYNIFNPSNFHLMRVLFAGMVIGAMITTYFSVRIISIRGNVNKALASFQEHMKDMLVFMRRENLDQDLQKVVLDYYEYNWDKMGGVNYRQVLKLCDQITLRTDTILHIYGPTFAKCPFLVKCDVSLLRHLGRAVRSVYLLRDMPVVELHDVIADMYFVDYGSVDVLDTSDDNSTLSKLTRGSVFGNLDKSATARSSVTFMASSRVHLLQINSTAFHHIISDFPAVLALVNKYRSNNADYIIGNMGESLRTWKEQSPSLPAVVRNRKGLIKHLHLKEKFIQMYLIIVSLLCIYLDVYNAGFQDNRTVLIIILYVLDIGFYVKILAYYSLPYMVDSLDFKKVLLPIRRTYFNSEFKYDLLSCLPIELLSLLSFKHRWMLFSWLRFNRIFRIVTVYKSLKRHNERLSINLPLSTACAVLVWFTLFVHTAASLWHYVGLMEEHTEPRSSWIHNNAGGSWCHNYYICSVYFILTTFTQNGVGDIMPKKQSEVVFVCILQIISTMVYMIYVGEFSNIIQYQSFRSVGFYCKYLELQEFLKNNRVSKNLVAVVNKYSLHVWRESRGEQVPDLLRSAPRCLKLAVMSAAYLEHLTSNPVFKNCEPAFLRQLVGHLQLYIYNEGMYVVKESQITDSMYLIHSGHVQETGTSRNTLKVFNTGECFGMYEGLNRNTPYAHTYQTLTKSRVLTLHLADWEYLLEHFPQSKNLIFKYMQFDDDHPDKQGDPEVINADPSKFIAEDLKKEPSSLRVRPPEPPPSPPPFPPAPPSSPSPSAADRGLTF
ncbi:uncharacterized protein LOC113513870 [Galleria mellonella]|uniref:Uncharacterized protein LOC113513870 n=1 Tax=Galleria mellonella TaxID=7137 RepID=A0ABM3N2S4_GALME|nr:uncharacterized protein LOC113513870 [Galleria mellonella]